MSETKPGWTPGPWKVYGTWVHPVLEDGSNGNESHSICACNGPDLLPNAHLIASSPDLYAALERLTEAVAKMRVPQSTAEAGLQIAVTIGPALVSARSALARARGET